MEDDEDNRQESVLPVINAGDPGLTMSPSPSYAYAQEPRVKSTKSRYIRQKNLESDAIQP